MNEIEILTKKFMLVGIDDAKISTLDKPIIGTQALATCYGVIIYSEERKLTVVAHISSKEPDSVIEKIFTILLKEKLSNKALKYKIIDGYFPENIELKNYIQSHFEGFKNYQELDIPNDAIQIDEKTTSKQFAFDTISGTFVTEKVLFGTDHLIINDTDEYDDTNNNIKNK